MADNIQAKLLACRQQRISCEIICGLLIAADIKGPYERWNHGLLSKQGACDPPTMIFALASASMSSAVTTGLKSRGVCDSE